MMSKQAMRLGLSVGDVSEEALQGYSQAGIKTIELSLGSKKSFPFPGFEGLPDRAGNLGIETYSLHLPFSPFNELDISSTDKNLRKNSVDFLSEQIKTAGDSGFSVAVIHASGEPIPAEARGEKMECAKESLAFLAGICEQSGMTLAVEDLPRTCLGNCIAEIKELISADDRLRVCFDTNHLLTEYGHDFAYALGSKIINVHVSDYDFRNERHWMPYEGKTDWIKLVCALEDIGYSGPFTYELGLYPQRTIERRIMTYQDIVENYRACMEKRPAVVLGTPIKEKCDEGAYYKVPVINTIS